MSKLVQEISKAFNDGNLVRVVENQVLPIPPETESEKRLIVRAHPRNMPELQTDLSRKTQQSQIMLTTSVLSAVGAYQCATEPPSAFQHDLSVPFALIAIGAGIMTKNRLNAAKDASIKFFAVKNNAEIAQKELATRGIRFE